MAIFAFIQHIYDIRVADLGDPQEGRLSLSLCAKIESSTTTTTTRGGSDRACVIYSPMSIGFDRAGCWPCAPFVAMISRDVFFFRLLRGGEEVRAKGVCVCVVAR